MCLWKTGKILIPADCSTSRIRVSHLFPQLCASVYKFDVEEELLSWLVWWSARLRSSFHQNVPFILFDRLNDRSSSLWRVFLDIVNFRIQESLFLSMIHMHLEISLCIDNPRKLEFWTLRHLLISPSCQFIVTLIQILWVNFPLGLLPITSYKRNK